jgi:hypothetical protein
MRNPLKNKLIIKRFLPSQNERKIMITEKTYRNQTSERIENIQTFNPQLNGQKTVNIFFMKHQAMK